MMEIKKIKSGKHTVIFSGVVTSNKKEEIIIELTGNFSIVFTFISDEQVKETKIYTEQYANGNGVNFKLLNFNNSLGTGTVEPILFGKETESGKKLSISFVVYSIGLEVKTLMYTIFKDEEI